MRYVCRMGNGKNVFLEKNGVGGLIQLDLLFKAVVKRIRLGGSLGDLERKNFFFSKQRDVS